MSTKRKGPLTLSLQRGSDVIQSQVLMMRLSVLFTPQKTTSQFCSADVNSYALFCIMKYVVVVVIIIIIISSSTMFWQRERAGMCTYADTFFKQRYLHTHKNCQEIFCSRSCKSFQLQSNKFTIEVYLLYKFCNSSYWETVPMIHSSEEGSREHSMSLLVILLCYLPIFCFRYFQVANCSHLFVWV